ncbi:MAG TPA: TldD/PmbA family protein [Gemmatimonadales bacterium]
MILDERQARAILEKALRLSQAEECTVRLNGGTSGNIRYARNTVTTAGGSQNTSLSVSSSFGKRTGSASVNELDDASIERTVRRAEELARLAPENPEQMPLVGPQTFAPTPAYFESTATITPEFRAEVAAAGILPAKARDCTAAGFLSDSAGFSAMLNSKGLFAYHRSTGIDFSLTVRSNDGTGSGYVTRDANDVRKFDAKAASAIALEKAVASRSPRAIEPGKYTVILEPEASVELIQNMMGFDARNAEEGRSWLAAAGGKTRLGEKLMDERVTIYSDPAHPEVPASPWTGEGLPRKRTMWIEKGVVKNLSYSRYWAEKQGKEPLPGPANIIMEGGTDSLEELIRGTRRGILLTRTWYIRTVDPQTLLYTGLTRDGTFYIEDGQIRHAVKNFRFNESPVIMLNNLDALGRPERIRGNLIPPMRVRDFTFTSLSDAI